MLAIETILHPTDFSEPSQCALDLACGLAADYGANLVVIHVIAAPPLQFGGVIFPGPARLERIREQLDDMEVSVEGFDVIRGIAAGNPASEILAMARLSHADLIVMGS